MRFSFLFLSCTVFVLALAFLYREPQVIHFQTQSIQDPLVFKKSFQHKREAHPKSNLPAMRPQLFLGKVQQVLDGDTINIVDSEARVLRLRILGIDSPEIGQAFGSFCQRALTSAIKSRLADVELYQSDQYGRWVSRVKVGGKDIGLNQIESGCAWVDKDVSMGQSIEDQTRYLSAQVLAQTKKLGLWSASSQTPPWRFRKVYKKSLKPEGT